MLRSIASVVVLLISVLLIAVANIGWWVRIQVLDAKQFSVATTNALADPNVHTLLVEGITLAALNVAQQESDVPPQFYEHEVRKAVDQVVAMPEILPIFQQAIVIGHDALFTEKFQQVELDLNPMMPTLNQVLKTSNPLLFSQLPPLHSMRIPVLSGDQIPSIAKPAQELRTYAAILLISAIAWSVIFVAISRRRDRALAIFGASLAVIIGMQLVFVEVALPHMLSWIQEPMIRKGSAAILHSLLATFTRQSYQLLYLGTGIFIGFAIIAVVRGRSRKVDIRSSHQSSAFRST